MATIPTTATVVFDPPSILPTCQHNDDTCAVAAIATLCSVAYARVWAHVCHTRGGLTQRQIVALCARLGYRTKAKRAIAWDSDCGLLTTVFPASQHVCVLWRGMLFDPADGRLWEDAETYLSVEQVRASVLTTLIKR